MCCFSLSSLWKRPAAGPVFIFSSGCPEALQRAIWAKYEAYRKSKCLKPFHERRDAYKIKLFRMGAHVVKEYSGARDAVLQEVAVMQQLHHSNLLGFLTVVDEGRRISVVMEWAGEGLREHRTLSQPQQYSEELVRHVMYQLTHALSYLHHKGIIHRDIKPDNIAIQADHTVQLFDWNEALILDKLLPLTDKQLAQQAGLAGTPFFMPPEVLNYITGRDATKSAGGFRSSGGTKSAANSAAAAAGSRGNGCGGVAASRSGGQGGTSWGQQQHQQQQQLSARQQRAALLEQRYQILRRIISPKLDIWGLGTVLYFLLAGRDIFVQDSSWELENLAEVASASYGTALPAGVSASPGARDFLRRCLERNPDQRATAKELLLHPWLKGLPLSAVACSQGGAVLDLPWMPQPESPALSSTIRAFSPSTPE